MNDDSMAHATPVIDRIRGPEDLKGLSLPELVQLAREVRQELVEVVSEIGGHLGSNLGTVELTIALHSLLDSPKDKIVWDVGHQAYVHKLLTGRRARFATIRQHGGLCGFPERTESPHDVWGAGHASTSLSAALGMAVARDLAGDDYNVLGIIGDGGLTGGMAFEALNQIGHLGRRMVVVLNDNGMSISPNVGALNRLFNRFRLDARYHHTKSDVGRVVTRLPLGNRAWEAGRAVKRGVKGIVIPSVLWEQLGFEYVGPVNGHDIGELRAALGYALNFRSRPVFLHVFTSKGKGYDKAEGDAGRLHAVSPGGSKGGPPTYSKVFGDTVAELLQRDPRVVAVTAAMLDGTGLAPIARQFPSRVFDVGIAEQHAVTFAAGMATQGCRPIAAIYSTFLQRGYDQVIHDVCIQNLPVAFALDRAGVAGDDGKTHQGAFDLSYLRCLPNIIVAAPKDEEELRHLLYTATQVSGPMAVRYPRGPGLGVPLGADLHVVPVGTWERLREGSDVALLATGYMVGPAMQAAARLSEHNVRAGVINARYIKPLDRDMLREIASLTPYLLTAEENVLAGGFGSAVLAALNEDGFQSIHLESIGMPDQFIEHGSQPILRAKYGLTADAIVQRVLATLQETADVVARPR
ncbi:MAG: 1-deoxy-D-xylulose-5-phosphate synthase [Dehalococcoidia bacterium]